MNTQTNQETSQTTVNPELLEVEYTSDFDIGDTICHADAPTLVGVIDSIQHYSEDSKDCTYFCKTESGTQFTVSGLDAISAEGLDALGEGITDDGLEEEEELEEAEEVEEELDDDDDDDDDSSEEVEE